MGRPKGFDPDIAVREAMAVFWRKGYASTTPQDLVDALGIGKGSLYNAFGSKHALFELALKCYRDEQAVLLIEHLERPGPVKERLRDVIEAVVELDLSDPERRGCMAVNTAAELGAEDEIAADLVRRMNDRTEGALKALIEEGRRSGEIDSAQDAGALASMILSTVIGLRLLAKTDQGPERSARIVEGLFGLL